MINSKTLLKSLIWLKTGCGKNESRKNLKHIHFKQENNVLTIMTANAFMILTESFENDIGKNEKFEFLSDIEYWYQIEGFLKKLNRDAPEVGAVSIKKDRNKFYISSHWDKEQIRTVDLVYPDLSKLINQREHLCLESGSIRLDADNLRICLNGFYTVDINFHGELEPAHIQDGISTRKAVILPIKKIGQ